MNIYIYVYNKYLYCTWMSERLSFTHRQVFFWCDIIYGTVQLIIQFSWSERWSACGWSSPSAILLWSWPSMVVLASGTPVLWHECFGWSDWYVRETWMNQWCVVFRGKLLWQWYQAIPYDTYIYIFLYDDSQWTKPGLNLFANYKWR